jgi:acylphosphatase
MMTQAHVYIKGEVIGVGFRAWTKIQAKIAGVKGWIRNTHDKEDIFGAGGGVEAVFQGEQENVDKMIEILKKGSSISHVEEVEVMWQEPKELFEIFEIRPSV